jgi:type IV pilus assembly protein PilM
VARSRVVGLDVGTTQVRAAELAFDRGGPRADGRATLVRHGAVGLPRGAVRDGQVVDPEAVSGALRQLWKAAGFGTRSVILGVGSQRVLVRELELPWMTREDLRRALPFQIADLLPMPVDEALLDFYPTEEVGDDGARVVRGLLVAADRDTVTRNLQAVQSAGLRVSTVDLNAFALQRALIRGGHRDRTVALVDVGTQSTTVVVAARGVPKLVRTIASGGTDTADDATVAWQRAVREVAATSGDIAPAGVGLRERTSPAIDESIQSLVDSIRNTFVYYASHNPGVGIELALLTGTGTGLHTLSRHLSGASRVPVDLADPLAWVDLRTPVDGPVDGLAVAIGLAHGGVS